MAKQFNYDEMFNILEDYVGLSEQTIMTVVKINGQNRSSYEDILYVWTGYNDFEQYMEEEGNKY